MVTYVYVYCHSNLMWYVYCITYLQHLYSEAKRISSEASQGIYLDPTQNPMRVLDQLKVVW